MAGEWIKLELATINKPEVMRIARILDAEQDLVLGKLIRLWIWFDKNTVDGDVDGIVDADVDGLVSMVGFCSALRAVRWIEDSPDGSGLRIPNFQRHNGESAKKRALKNERQARWRVSNTTKSSTPASTPASTREEKRRVIPPIPLSGGFEAFWKAWPPGPRKASRGKCFEVWSRKALDPEASRIVAHVEAMKSTQGWREGYVPAPLVYLNQARWDGADVVTVVPDRQAVM